MTDPSRAIRRMALVAGAVALLAARFYLAAPDTPAPPADAAAGAEAPGPPQTPKPTSEHAALARLEGTWDASVQISMGSSGTPSQVSHGVETSRLCCDGLWLVTEFRSSPDAPPFEGHGIAGFDPAKKKYISTWVDSDLTIPMTSEGTYDAAKKTLTMRGSMTSKGKTLQWRNVEVWKSDDERQFTMYQRGPDGKETPSLSIAYTRRK